MKKLGIAVAMLVMMPNLLGQAPAKPSPYSGVSQPPPDDTITSDEAPSAPTARLVTRPAAVPAPPPANSVAAPTAVAPVPVAPVQVGCNPDDRMIGDPLPCDTLAAGALPPGSRIDPDEGIVALVPSHPGELPEGTIIRMALSQEISTGGTQAGADFSGLVSADVLSSGQVVIPQGSEVVGKVLRVTEGHRFGTPATIRLRPDVVILPDGSRYVLRAQIIDTSGKTRIDGEGTLKPKSRIKKNAIKEGAGIGTGAVAGAIIGGAPGALVGSLIGAGVMTTNILVQHPASVNVPRDSTLTLSLTQPMSITPVLQTN